jgi:hypothetical protein
MNNLVGKKHIFDDGAVIEIIQIKQRDDGMESIPVVTYSIQNGHSIPRKLILPLSEFINTFGHLFEE